MRNRIPAPANQSSAGRSSVAGEVIDSIAESGSQAEALGRRILSTAFVMEGPDRLLTIERRDGEVLVLRDVVMLSKKYCGVHVLGGRAGERYCGGYTEIVGARAGGAPAAEQPDLANPISLGTNRKPQE